MSDSVDYFEGFYNRVFKDIPGAEDPDIRRNLKRVFDEVLEIVAHRFEYGIFEEYTGDRVAELIREMKGTE